jgi:predicted nucleotidyltransferase
MIYGLKNDAIEQIKSVFKRYHEIEKVILYGSRAKGNYRPNSDIDVTILGEDIDLTILNKISWELDDLMLPYTFDISIYKNISQNDFLDHIKRIGIEFYKKGE